MAAPKKRVRKASQGYIGVNLVKGGDMTLYNRLQEEAKSDPELDQTQIVRTALREYFERKDKNTKK